MKKHRFSKLVFLALFLTLCFSLGASAATVKSLSATGEVVNVQTSLVVRQTPSKSGEIIGSLKNGASVTITGETDNWYRISYGSGSGYVSKTYISATSKSSSTVVSFTATGYVTGVSTGLNVRSGPSTSYSVLGTLSNGTKVSITGESYDWYRISYGSGSGYVSNSYISFSSSSSSTTEKTGTVHVNSTLLVRKQPSSSGTILGYLTNGKTVTIVGESGGYYQIRYNSSLAYVSSSYVTVGSSSSSSSGSSSGSSSSSSVTSLSMVGYANVTSSLLVRSSASTSGSIIGRYSRGEKITITGETGNWYQVSYSGKTGYVNKAYVSTTAISSSSSTTTYKTISLNVPLYHQYDSRWASVKIGSSTLKNAGCATTCLAMIEEYRTGVTCTPAMMVSKLSYTSSGAVYWPSGTTQYTGSNYLSVIYQQLAAGNPVIVGAKYTTGGQHYVVVTGYNGSSTSLSASGFTVNDPGTGGTKTLQAFLNRTPYFYKLVYYY